MHSLFDSAVRWAQKGVDDFSRTPESSLSQDRAMALDGCGAGVLEADPPGLGAGVGLATGLSTGFPHGSSPPHGVSSTTSSSSS